MKCEIINGWLVVEPGTPTERYAFAQWLESRSSWNSVQSSVRSHDPKIDAPEPNPVMVWATAPASSPGGGLIMGLGQHLKLMLIRAERDALRAEIEQLKTQSDEWRDVAARDVRVLQLNNIKVNGEYYAKCLNEIRAEAIEGFFACFESESYWDKTVNDVIDEGYKYAAKVRKGGEQ